MTDRSLCLLLSLVLMTWPPATLHAARSDRLFPETGWHVSGQFLAFWEAGGGLPVFGLPIGPEKASMGGLRVQQFERARLELHPQHASPYDFELGRLGDRKSTRLNSSHVRISYAVFCLKKKKKKNFIHLSQKKKKKTNQK